MTQMGRPDRVWDWGERPLQRGHVAPAQAGAELRAVAEESCFDALPSRKKQTAVPEVFDHQQVCVGSWKREFLAIVNLLLVEHNQSAFPPTG